MIQQPKIILFLVSLGLMSAACESDNPAGPGVGATQRAFVLNSVAKTISVIDLDNLSVSNNAIALGSNSSAVGLVIRGTTAIVPNGSENNALIVDVAALNVSGTVDLPQGSGATGAAFLDDNTAFVGNLNLASISRIDLVGRSVTATISVGQVPSDILVASGKVFVANANVDFNTFQALGNGTVSVIDPATNQVTNTIDSRATNSQFLALDPDGDLLVINSGAFGANDGSVTVIDPASERVIAGPFVIGDFPGQVSINASGVAYIASFSNGLYAFDTASNTVLRNAQEALAVTTPGGAPIGAVACDFDNAGNIYSLSFGDAITPGTVYIFSPQETLVDSIKVGVGPFDIVIP